MLVFKFSKNDKGDKNKNDMDGLFYHFEDEHKKNREPGYHDFKMVSVVEESKDGVDLFLSKKTSQFTP